MEQKTSKKIFHICMIIAIIAAILFGVGILVLRYQVEGETNMPFEISKISVISSVDSTTNSDEANMWNMNVIQNNDIYVYIDKNNSYGKTEIIENVVLENFTINKDIEKGQMHIYKPVEENVAMFKNSEENITDQIIYTGEMYNESR